MASQHAVPASNTGLPGPQRRSHIGAIVGAVILLLFLTVFLVPMFVHSPSNGGSKVNNPPTTPEPQAISVGVLPEDIVYDSGNGYLYVVNHYANPGANIGSVTVISGASNKVLATLLVGSDPVSAAYDSDNGNVYVYNALNANLTVINGITVSTWIPIPGLGEYGAGPPFNMVYDNQNHEIYSTAFVFDAGNDSWLPRLPLGPAGGATGAMAYDTANQYLYIGILEGESLSVDVAVDSTFNNSLVTTIPLGSGHVLSTVDGLIYDPQNDYVYATTSPGNGIQEILPARETVLDVFNVPGNPYAGIYDPVNGDLFLTQVAANSVAIIAGSTNSIVANVSVGVSPLSIAFDGGNSDVYVANSNSNNISVITPTTIPMQFEGGSVGLVSDAPSDLMSISGVAMSSAPRDSFNL